MAHDPSDLRRPVRPRTDATAADDQLASAAVDRGRSPVEDEQTLELREEELVAHKELREAGQVRVRTRVEEVPSRLEVEAYYEEVEVQHQPVGQAVSERRQPWEENGELIVPVYEEQLVVTKRLILREQLRIRRVGSHQTQVFEDTIRRDRLVVEDPQQTGRVRETYPTDEPRGGPEAGEPTVGHEAPEQKREGGVLENLVLKALQ